MRLRERLKAGDPDLTADELQAAIDRAEAKRRQVFDVQPTGRENARVLAAEYAMQPAALLMGAGPGTGYRGDRI